MKPSEKKTKVKREAFKPPYGNTISQMIQHVLSYQSKLARAIRNCEVTEVRYLIRFIQRDKLCTAYSVYRTISTKGARSPGHSDIKRPVTQNDYDNLISRVFFGKLSKILINIRLVPLEEYTYRNQMVNCAQFLSPLI